MSIYKIKNILSFFTPNVFFIFILLPYIYGCSVSKVQDDLPPIPETSIYLNEIDDEYYHVVRHSQNAQLLRWDFSNKNKYIYKYLKKSITNKYTDALRQKSNDYLTIMHSDGILVVDSQGDQTADLVLKDMEAVVKTGNEKGESGNSALEIQAPTMVIQGMKEDGRMNAGLNTQELFLKILFPIPSKALKVGEHVNVDETVLFNVNGNTITVTGKSKIALTRYVKIKDHFCARLEADIDISNIENTHDLIGGYNCVTKGKSVFYFDIENRCFLAGSAAIIMSMRIRAKMPKKYLASKKEQANIQPIAVDNDNLISISLIDVIY